MQSCITRICRRTCTDSDKKKLVYIEAKTIVIVCPMNKLLLSYALSYTEEKTFDEFKRPGWKTERKEYSLEESSNEKWSKFFHGFVNPADFYFQCDRNWYVMYALLFQCSTVMDLCLSFLLFQHWMCIILSRRLLFFSIFFMFFFNSKWNQKTQWLKWVFSLSIQDVEI